MVILAVPGERWEVEFFQDGTVEIERFVSTGVKADQAEVERILKKLEMDDHAK